MPIEGRLILAILIAVSVVRFGSLLRPGQLDLIISTASLTLHPPPCNLSYAFLTCSLLVRLSAVYLNDLFSVSSLV